MKRIFLAFALLATVASSPAVAQTDPYQDTINVFKKAGESGRFFKAAYGYAVFPTIGKAGVVVGGAFGRGRVYENGRYVGDTSVTQATIGFQLGGQAYSEIIFFKDKRAFDEFTSGNFEFGAQASAVAITAGASVSANTAGSSGSASGTKRHAETIGNYYRGMAVFTVAKGGLMYEFSVGGQKFSYKKVN